MVLFFFVFRGEREKKGKHRSVRRGRRREEKGRTLETISSC